jgi:dimethylhistidine N-methyltransferase
MSRAIHDAADPAFLEEVCAGLARTPKVISSRWLYDETGSELFEDITQLPEYYPTRTETAIFTANAAQIANEAGPRAVLVEYGAGAAVKTRILLDALNAPCAYAPLDISEAFLATVADGLRADYPGLDIHPIAADFMSRTDLSGLPDCGGRRVGFFPGSTIGNLTDEQIAVFLTEARRGLGRDARFLLGADLKKSPDILVPAYDDASGVTAAFNLNLLHRINRELGGDFDVSAFEHEARWNDADSRIEMHLVSLRDQLVEVAGRQFTFQAAESIRTEISRKFELAGLRELARSGGWELQRTWQDEAGFFCVALLA